MKRQGRAGHAAGGGAGHMAALYGGRQRAGAVGTGQGREGPALPFRVLQNFNFELSGVEKLKSKAGQEMELCIFWAGQGRGGPALASRLSPTSCTISKMSFSGVEKLKMALLQLLDKAGQ